MIHYIVSPKWESFQNFLAGMLNLSLGFISATGELVSLFNSRPPYAGLACSPERDAAFHDFFVQASHAAKRIGAVRLLHDPSGMPVAFTPLADNLLLFLTGGFGAAKDAPLKVKAECVAALYLYIFHSFQQGRAQSAGDDATLFTLVDKLCRLTGTLYFAGELYLARIFNLVAYLLIIFCDAEAAFVLNRYHKAGQFVYQGMHEDMQILLRRQWERASIDEPDFLTKWNGVKKFGHLGLQLHMAASTGRKGPLCLGVVNPQSGHTRGNLDTFSKQTIVIAEAPWFCQSLDIARYRQAEEALRRREHECKTLAQHTPDIIARFNRDLCCIFVNEAVEKHTGMPRERLIGRKIENMHLLGGNLPVVKKTLQAVLSEGKETELALAFSAKENARFFNTKFFPEFTDAGEVQSVLCISRNITEHKLLEEEIIHTCKLESIATLAGGIAHDYNNFLATMLANISLAKLYHDDWEKVLARLAGMETAVLQAKELTRQLFVFAGDSESVKQTVGIRKLIIGSTDFALSGTNISPEYYLAEDLLPVEIDRGQINQIISNIVINAVQAMPQGGTIIIKAANIMLHGDEEKDEGIIPLPPGQYVMLSFADRGTGIAAAHLPKIFEPFFSTKEKGRGLGLAAARTIMQRHNGYIDVKSNINEGTTFTIYLPVAGETVQNGNKEEKIIKGRGRVLLMDDKVEMGKAAGEMLSYLGYTVTFVGDGVEAIAAYKEAFRTGRPFDLVILDLTVPGGMGGQAVLNELLAVDPEVKAILTSGYANDLLVENYRAYGFKGAIVKPFKMEELSQIIHRCLSPRAV